VITSGILRAEAAVFDTDVIPSIGSNGTNGTNLGQAGNRWRKGYFADGDFSGTVTAESLTIGNGGAIVRKVYKGSFSVTSTNSIAAGNEIAVTQIISGASDLDSPDVVIVTPQTDPKSLVAEGFRVISGNNNKISGRLRNSSVNASVPAGTYTFNYLIIK
jgi:hypothetical protein